jgi:hypothetical protein
MIKVIIISVMFVLMMTGFVYAKEVSYTLEDRERFVRLETKVDEGFKAVNQRIDDVNNNLNKRIDELKDFMFWGFGILFGGMGILIGFVIWDRRTALAPAIRKNKELEEREEIIEKVLKEYAKEEPRLAEILKSLHLR